MNDSRIYLDYAATSPLCDEAASILASAAVAGPEGMMEHANANSLHSAGRSAYKQLEQARRSIANSLGASRPDEIIFTSGATEADNMALVGIAQAAAFARAQAQSGPFIGHIIVSAIEHDAVLAPAKRLASLGFEVEYLRPTPSGFIEVRALTEALRENTVLVSIQTANSEVGSIQAVQQLAAAAHHAGALFHTDATQALGKCPVDVGAWGVDAASFSAHKIGGPKGMGALYLKRRTPFQAQALGGGQETGRRSGTQDVIGARAFAAAVQAAVERQEQEQARCMRLRDVVYGAVKDMSDVQATVDVPVGSRDYLPNIVNLCIPPLESETLVLRFDAFGIEVSGGSACASASLDPSHVLRALGLRDDTARCEVRLSMGRYTTEADIQAFLAALPQVIAWKGGHSSWNS